MCGKATPILETRYGSAALAMPRRTIRAFVSVWDTVGSALIRPDGHLAWAADGTTDPATRAADATAALLRWLPGIAGARHYESAAS